MRTLLASIASLMLVLTLWSGFQSSVAYAAEVGTCLTVVDGTSLGHLPGDADEVPGDSDKATPHHHSVSHSHEVGVPARVWAGMYIVHVAVPRDIAAVAPPTPFAPHRDLRPPIA